MEFITLLSVSYTHLPAPSPVFSSAPVPPLCFKFSKISNASLITLLDFFPLMFTTAPIPHAVSYTHLDVYKRQVFQSLNNLQFSNDLNEYEIKIQPYH